MKLNYFLFAAAGLTGFGLMALNASVQNSTQQVTQARVVPAGSPTAVSPSQGVVSTQTVVHLKAPVPSSAGGPLSNNVIAWDAETKEVVLKAGETEAHYTFNLTNVSPSDVKVTSVTPSCGCTVAQLASPLPWTLAPGATAQIPLTMHVAPNAPAVMKTVTVGTDKGAKTLMIKAIGAPPAPTPISPPTPAPGNVKTN